MASSKKTSLPKGKETLQHFTHPHVLIKEVVATVYEGNSGFICSCCGMEGSGIMYYSKQCDYGIHEDCATCPEYLTTNFHPDHQLERIWEGLQEDESESSDDGQSRPCGVCGDEVKGFFYKCSSGAAEKSHDDDKDHYFCIHPSCSKLPFQIILKLQSVPVSPDAMCSICGDLVSSSPWSYISDPSGLNIHPQCVTLPNDNYQSEVVANVNALAVAMATSNMMARTNAKMLQQFNRSCPGI
ncbi:uncharacterized protein LOC113272758 [Papaver somniferum]|uniref:uncharacterized protein LOC113272758 n=1 Tax=Papaver somniferum TaxID=3469 RepID=UPI000E6FBFA0|nr:uncharacterized protein LOC113272758 [Papaver somniferum]